MDKPISLIIEETKQEIANVLNKSQLHPYMMDTIIRDLYEEVHTLYIKTIQTEKKEYEKSLNEVNKVNESNKTIEATE